VFFDGECGMCGRLVRALLRADRRGALAFAPLQGETARRLLPPLPPDRGEWGLVYLDERGIHRKADATFEVLRRLGGLWSIPALARFLPRPLRDGAYRHVARNRYRWSGRAAGCRVPTPEERGRFLP